MEILFSAKILSQVWKEPSILSLNTFPNGFTLRFRIVQGYFCFICRLHGFEYSTWQLRSNCNWLSFMPAPFNAAFVSPMLFLKITCGVLRQTSHPCHETVLSISGSPRQIQSISCAFSPIANCLKSSVHFWHIALSPFISLSEQKPKFSAHFLQHPCS